MQRVHFTSDGVYGEYGKTFDVSVALRVADAVAKVTRDATLANNPSASEQCEAYVTFDVRDPSQEIARAVAKQLAGHGYIVKLARSYTPMPALNYALRTHDNARVGIMITGDHRGQDTLGIRIRDERGAAPHPSEMDAIEDEILPRALSTQGTYSECDFNTPFFEHAKTWAPEFTQLEGCVLVDAMYGCASSYAASLLRAYGADVVELHGNLAEQKTLFHPEVAEPWIDDLEYACSKTGCLAGLALDGSANRAAVVTSQGKVVSLGKVSALFMRYLVEKKGQRGLILLPRTASFIIKKQAEALGLDIRYVTKPERWAEEEVANMNEVLLAGDGLHSLIIPSLDPERDGFVILIMLAAVLASYRKSLDDLLAELTATLGHSYYTHRDIRVEVGEFEMLKNVLPGLSPSRYFSKPTEFVSHTDGLYVSFTDGAWVYVRPSTTEALVHVYAEASSKPDRNELINSASTLLKQVGKDFAGD